MQLWFKMVHGAVFLYKICHDSKIEILIKFPYLDIACMNLTLLEDSSNSYPISGDQPQHYITSLHDSVPSLNTNIHQNYGMEDSNLVPITEEDEKSSFNYNHEDLQAGEFKRGGVARSTIRNSKKKNFKQLKVVSSFLVRSQVSVMQSLSGATTM